MDKLTEATLSKIRDENILSDQYTLEKSKDNKNIIVIENSGELLYLGNKESVETDLQNIKLKLNNISMDNLVIIFGMGSGECLLEILRTVGKLNKVLIVEPDINIIRKFLELEYSKKVIEDDRVSIVLFDPKELRYIFEYFIEENQVTNLRNLIHPQYEVMYREQLFLFLKELKYYMELCARNLLTGTVISKGIFKAYMNNVKHILKSVPLNSFKDIFKNIPAVIVSAGPSLDKNISKLKEVQDEFIIVCGNRTLRPLIENNIEPDFLVALDTSYKIYEHIQDNLNCKAPLVFTEGTNDNVLDKYSGKKIFVKDIVYDDYIEEILEKNLDKIYQGGSVAHVCTDFSVYLGCNPVIFIGQDLAYTNNKEHALSAQNKNDVSSKEYIYIKDINGEEVLTSRTLYGFKKELENYMITKKKANKELTFVNSTEGGSNIEGTIVMDLSDAILKYKKSLKDHKDISEIFSNYELKDTITYKKKVEEVLQKILFIKKECARGIELCGKIMKSNDQAHISKILNKLYKINELIDNTKELDFITHILTEVFNKYTNDFRYSEDKKQSVVDKTKKMTEAFKNLYEGIINCIEESEPLIKECILSLDTLK